MPDGIRENVNNAAIEHYIKLIDELEQLGIEPVVTLFNYWEMPKELEGIH